MKQISISKLNFHLGSSLLLYVLHFRHSVFILSPGKTVRLLLLFGLCAENSFAQVMPPANTQAIRVRLYGKNAKPLGEKSPGYDFNVEWRPEDLFIYGNNTSESQQKLTFSDVKVLRTSHVSRFLGGHHNRWTWWWDENELCGAVATSGFLPQLMNITVKHGPDTMLLKTGANMLRVPFKEGEYVVPYEYGPLFELDCPEGMTILNQDLKFFRIDKPQPFEHTPEVQISQLAPPLPAACRFNYRSGETGEQASLIRNNRTTNQLYLRTFPANGSGEDSVPIQPLPGKNSIPEVFGPFTQRGIPLIYKKWLEDVYEFNWVQPSGVAEQDTFLTRMNVSSICFYDKNVWYAIAKPPGGYTHFIATTDAGIHWEKRAEMVTAHRIYTYGTGDTIWIYTNDGYYYRYSTDGCSTFHHAPERYGRINKELLYPARNPISFPHPKHVILYGDQSQQDNPQHSYETPFHFSISAGTDILIFDRFLLVSTDSRNSWTYYPLPFRKGEILIDGENLYGPDYEIRYCYQVNPHLIYIESSSHAWSVYIP